MNKTKLNDALECPICLELLDSSNKMLPCQHSFCLKCLHHLFSKKKELRCPECRLLVDIYNQADIDNLPSNLFVMRVLETMGIVVPKKCEMPEKLNLSSWPTTDKYGFQSQIVKVCKGGAPGQNPGMNPGQGQLGAGAGSLGSLGGQQGALRGLSQTDVQIEAALMCRPMAAMGQQQNTLGGLGTVGGAVVSQTGPTGATGLMQNMSVPATQSQESPTSQLNKSGQEMLTIWQGVLEWIEKPPNNGQKNTWHLPCQISAHSKDGEPELKADSWPQKLIMQLMPKQLIGNIGGAYLKNCKSMLFHPQPCEALESLAKVMSSGFVGCVHFTNLPTSSCDIKVLIVLYTPEKRAYLGFIPNYQAAFVDRLCEIVHHQKTSHALYRQGQGGAHGQNPGMNLSQGHLRAVNLTTWQYGRPARGLGMFVPVWCSYGGLVGRRMAAMEQQQNTLGGPGTVRGAVVSQTGPTGVTGLMQTMLGPAAQNQQPPTSQPSSQMNIQPQYRQQIIGMSQMQRNNSQQPFDDNATCSTNLKSSNQQL